MVILFFGIQINLELHYNQLFALNPKITDGLRAGMVLKVKKLEAAYVKKNGDALSVDFDVAFWF